MATATAQVKSRYVDKDFKALSELMGNLDDAFGKQAQDFYDGDHWQGGLAWSGPRPDESEDSDFDDVMKTIEDNLVSSNKVYEVVKRHRDAVIGHEPDWKFVLANPEPPQRVKQTNEDGEEVEVLQDVPPTPEQQTIIDEANTIFRQWISSRKVLQTIQRVVTTALLRKRAVVRLFVPTKFLEEGATGMVVAKEDLLPSINKIFLSTPSVTDATVFTHEASQESASLYKYEDEEGNKIIEISFTFPEGDAIMTQVNLVSEQGIEEGQPIDLGGNLIMYELELEHSLITEQFLSMQKFMNVNLTMWQRNQVFAGFRERWLMNAEPPGEEKIDKATGRREFYPGVFTTGPGSANLAYGISKGKNQNTGKAELTTPELHVLEPVEVKSFDETDTKLYNKMLDEVKQPHVKLNEAAAASGRSKIESRADFRASLNDTETAITGLWEWLGATVVGMASAFAGQPGRFNILRMSASCRIDTGPLSPEEIEAGLKLVEAKIWSKEYFCQLTGIEDTDAMFKEIDEENPKDGLEVKRLQQDVEAEARLAGVNPPAAEDTGTGTGAGNQLPAAA